MAFIGFNMLHLLSLVLLYLQLGLFFSMIVLSVSCNKKEPIVDKISETSVDLQMIEAYEAGIEELEKGNVLVAAKKFNEA